MAGVKQFSAKQKTAMTWWANPRYQEYDAIICDGAVRSGKTLSMGMGFFLWAMRRFTLWLRMHGYGCRAVVDWEDINLQDEVEETKAALYLQQARKLRQENDEAEGK